MVYVFGIPAADAEADRGEHLLHDAPDIAASLLGSRVGEHSLVSAGNIVSDVGRADRFPVRDDAADLHDVALLGDRPSRPSGPLSGTKLLVEGAFHLPESPHANSFDDDLYVFPDETKAVQPV